MCKVFKDVRYYPALYPLPPFPCRVLCVFYGNSNRLVSFKQNETVRLPIRAPSLSCEFALPCSLAFETLFHTLSPHSHRNYHLRSMPANEYKFRVILDFGEATSKNMDARGSIAFLSVLQVLAACSG